MFGQSQRWFIYLAAASHVDTPEPYLRVNSNLGGNEVRADPRARLVRVTRSGLSWES
ncbi:hypothetical protein FIBSPDRAFT_871732 [Athelia psychrophila]|uniref:Uncharacterized protein n=1 Tax=Athelia psychrophila TaxID=1759441 RepID=A0A166A409_9AGAM|nr:hypothetical protein FIBSPDRAFT_871732 [Fibularhizoctonia sp. CBS 109695]